MAAETFACAPMVDRTGNVPDLSHDDMNMKTKEHEETKWNPMNTKKEKKKYGEKERYGRREKKRERVKNGFFKIK